MATFTQSVARLAAVLALAPVASGCALTKYAEQAEIARLTIQRNALVSLKTDLNNGTTAPDKQDLELLVGAAVLNQTLSIADKLSMPIPNYAQGEVVVNQIRYAALDGSGLLTVDASAIDHQRNLTLNVVVVARLAIASDGKLLHGNVVVEKIVPVLTGRCWSIGLIRFAQTIADAAATDWSLKHLAFDIPMSQAVLIDLPEQNRIQTIPLPDGTLSGRLHVPQFLYDDKVTLRAIWLLRDGVHVLIAH